MTREEYLAKAFETYRLISVLADKNGCRAIRVRHRTMERDLVLHSLPHSVAAYTMLATISCENLPTVYDAVDLEDGQIVWEEWVDGLTVAEVMESGHYRYRGARRVLDGVCRALTVLHERGFVHRDVKPENVVICPNGRVVLIDFNAAHRVSALGQDTTVMGTVGYASPEQMGITQSDARTDIYAAGVLLNVMITGCHPSKTLAGGKVGRIVRRCTMVSPQDRYATAEKLRRIL